MQVKLTRFFLTLALGLAGISAWAQMGVKGTVSDSYGPMVGVSIIEKGTSNGTTTDLDGNFTITVSDNATLVISSIGYATQEVAAAPQLTIFMKEDSEFLEETVVVGYGVQKKKLVTGSTVQVKGDDLAAMNTVSALGALQSQTPGVNITVNNGQPGEGFKVNIRGLGTTGDSEPLYVIDGVAGGDINSLNPSDIETIDVLKDAASAAIYGARAANGVILVTTKQGKEGKMQVSYDMYYGWQNLYKRPATLTAQETMAMADEKAFQDGNPAINWEGRLGAKTWKRLQEGWKGTDWVEAILVPNAPTQNHALNIAGGTEISKFSGGFSYTDQNGILGKPVASHYNRYTARLNSDHVLLRSGDRDVIKVGENLTFYYSTKTGIGQLMRDYNDIRNAITASALLPMYDDEGNLYDRKDKEADGWVYASNEANPVLVMKSAHGNNLSRNYGITATAYTEIMPWSWLKYRGAFSYRMTAGSSRSLTVPYHAAGNTGSDAYKVDQSASLGHRISWENTLLFTMPKQDKHSFDALLGQSFEKTAVGERMSVSNSAPDGSQLPTMQGDMAHAWITNTANSLTATEIGGSPWPEWALLSFFGRANYNYADRYMATVILRADGSSNFARGHRWGFFPSVSAGWVVSEEAFMEKTRDWLSFLKVRFSWGQNGNQSISNFQYLSPVAFDPSHTYNFGNTILNTTATKPVGAYATNLANPDVTWETSEQFDLGVDTRFLRSRLSLTADYYVKYTRDWLVPAPVLATAGTGAPYVNGGDVRNEGVELSLGWNDHVNQDFHYGMNVNFSYNKNIVTRIANDEGILHGDAEVLDHGGSEFYRAQEGFPIGYFWGYKTAGVFQNQQEIDEWIAAGNGVAQTDPQPGDLKIVDYHKDGVIDDSDKTMIGNPHPDFRLGVSANFGWRGLDASVTLNGAFGHQIVYGYRSSTTDAFDHWTGEGTSNRFPRVGTGATGGKSVTDTVLENGDFLRIQNLSLGYDLKHLIKKLPFQQLRLYVSAQNLYTFTKYPGLDPEVGFGGNNLYGGGNSWVSGIDLGSYPLARTYLVGLNFKF
jgi:TonB-linked SusC/RagA family outer membrane protein